MQKTTLSFNEQHHYIRHSELVSESHDPKKPTPIEELSLLQESFQRCLFSSLYVSIQRILKRVQDDDLKSVSSFQSALFF